LKGLPERKMSAVLQYAASERSVVSSYLYARCLGMEASVDDWEAFILKRYTKLDHRAILETEILKLTEDIASIRNAVEDGKIRLGDAPTKLSYLSKELRGHIEHLSKEVAVHDRRSLLLAGVELLSKSLKKVFGQDASTWPAIEATVESVFAEIELKGQA